MVFRSQLPQEEASATATLSTASTHLRDLSLFKFLKVSILRFVELLATAFMVARL